MSRSDYQSGNIAYGDHLRKGTHEYVSIQDSQMKLSRQYSRENIEIGTETPLDRQENKSKRIVHHVKPFTTTSKKNSDILKFGSDLPSKPKKKLVYNTTSWKDSNIKKKKNLKASNTNNNLMKSHTKKNSFSYVTIDSKPNKLKYHETDKSNIDTDEEDFYIINGKKVKTSQSVYNNRSPSGVEYIYESNPNPKHQQYIYKKDYEEESDQDIRTTKIINSYKTEDIRRAMTINVIPDDEFFDKFERY